MTTSASKYPAPDFALLFAALPGLYLVLSPDLTIIAASDAYLRATMTSRAAIVGRGLFEVFPDNPDDPRATGVANLRASLEQVIAQHVADSMAVQKYDVRRPEAEGGGFEERYWSPINSPVLNADGELLYIVHRVEDVTAYIRLKQCGVEQTRQTEDLRSRAEQMELEIFQRAQQLQEANRQLRSTNQELDRLNQLRLEFFANMSHELRTPLNAIVGMSGLLLDTHLDRHQRELARTARESSEMLLQLINDILDFSKVEEGRLELEEHPFDIRSCIEESLDLVAAKAGEKQLELTYLCDPQLPDRLSGDVARFRQVIVNLLANAVKFTAQGEVVAELSGHALPDREYELEVAVRDSGIGIPPDRLDRLFQPFRQADSSTMRQYGGTGLGLAICKRLVESMNGRISVDSTPGVGSTFRFTVKTGLVDDDAGAIRKPAICATDLMGRHALIVDDNDTNRRVLRLQCESRGMVVVDTASPLQALKWIRVGRPFDIVLLDHLMPEMDGLALAGEIRKVCGANQLKLVLMTSAGLPQQAVRDSSVNLQGVWTKPLHQSTLLDAIALLLGPQADALPDQRQEVTRTVAMFGRPLRILVAEDNPVNQRVVGLMLDKLGQKADMVATGQEAVSAITERHYDLVLMDILMPGMDGIEATRCIRSQLPSERQPRIIAMTASALSGDREHCLEAGMDDYISKPVKIDGLAQILARWSPSATARSKAPAGEPAEVATASEYNPQTLERWATALGPEVMVNVLNVMIGDATRLTRGLRAALDRFEPAQLTLFAHSLKSNARMVGATALGAQLQELETLGSAGSMGSPVQIYAVLEDYERLMQALAKLCERHAPRGHA